MHADDLQSQPVLTQSVTQSAAGECLYIPAGWGHKVITHEPTFAISYWWLKKPKALAGVPSRFYDESGNLISGFEVNAAA